MTAERVERWAASEIDPDRQMANRTREKTITVFHGCMERARELHRLPFNPVADVEKPRTGTRTGIEVFSPEEVMALVRAAESEQDAATFLTAAFTGLRQGELVALRWRDVDFAGSAIRVRASYTNGHLTSPKSGKVRSVPMAAKVAEALAKLGQREHFTDEDDLVFAALSKSYRAALERAALRPLRFHDLRHTFGTRVIGVADTRRAQEWMGRRSSTSTTSRARRTSCSRPSFETLAKPRLRSRALMLLRADGAPRVVGGAIACEDRGTGSWGQRFHRYRCSVVAIGRSRTDSRERRHDVGAPVGNGYECPDGPAGPSPSKSAGVRCDECLHERRARARARLPGGRAEESLLSKTESRPGRRGATVDEDPGKVECRVTR